MIKIKVELSQKEIKPKIEDKKYSNAKEILNLVKNNQKIDFDNISLKSF